MIPSAPGLENTGALVRLGLFSFLADLPPSHHPQAKQPAVRSSGLVGQRKRLKRRGSQRVFDQLSHGPNMIRETMFHGWCTP